MLDPIIAEEIEKAVKDEGQSEELARVLVAWLEAALDGSSALKDPERVRGWSQECFEKTSAD